jgi:hypothetical protein
MIISYIKDLGRAGSSKNAFIARRRGFSTYRVENSVIVYFIQFGKVCKGKQNDRERVGVVYFVIVSSFLQELLAMTNG